MTLNTMDREFVAVGAAIGAGCHPCTQYHTQAAVKAGLGAEQILWAIEQASAVRSAGGIAVGNVGRRLLGVEQRERPTQEPPGDRGTALARLGAAVGCNSGVLLGEYAQQAADLGADDGEVREAVEIAEAVKTMAGKFLGRETERIFGQAVAETAVSGGDGGCGCAGEA